MDALSLLKQFFRNKEPFIEMQNRTNKQHVGVVAARIVEIQVISNTHISVRTDAQIKECRYYDFKTA